MKNFILLLFTVLLVTGCSREMYKGIPKNKDIVIVTNQKDGSLSFIDAAKKNMIASWPIHKAIMGTAVLPDSDTIAVYGQDLESVYLYSLSKGTRVGEWKTGKGITNIIVSSSRQDILLADGQSNTVRLYNKSGAEIAAITVGKRPMTMVERDNQLYVLNFNDTVLSIVNLKEKRVIDTLSVPRSSLGAVIYGNELWIGGHGSGAEINENVYIYEDHSVKQKVPAPQMPVGFASDDEFIYILSHGSGMLRKINGNTHKDMAAIEVGANPFAVWLSGKALFVASYDSDEIYVVHADTMEMETIVKVGKGPFHMTERKGESR